MPEIQIDMPDVQDGHLSGQKSDTRKMIERVAAELGISNERLDTWRLVLGQRVKLEGTDRERVVQALRMAGWYEGRKVDISCMEEWYRSHDILLVEPAKRFLEEYCGLAGKWHIRDDYRPNVAPDFLLPLGSIPRPSGALQNMTYVKTKAGCWQGIDHEFSSGIQHTPLLAAGYVDFDVSLANLTDFIFDDEKSRDFSFTYDEDYDYVEKTVNKTFTYVGEIGYYYPSRVWVTESGKICGTHEYDYEVPVFDSVEALIESECGIMNFVTIMK